MVHLMEVLMGILPTMVEMANIRALIIKIMDKRHPLTMEIMSWVD